MTVGASKVACAAEDWTLIASGANSAMGFQVVQVADGLSLLPTNSNVKPAGLSASSPAWKVDHDDDNNFASDSTTYWWLWNPNKSPVDLIVWKL